MDAIAETVSVMKEMPEDKQNQVLAFAIYKLKSSEPKNPTVPDSDKELTALLMHSDKQYHDGKARNMKESINESRKKHGFI